jgi:uncharacterized protein
MGATGLFALLMLDESLHRCRNDHLDLWQIHGVCFENDPALFIRKGGAAEALEQAKEEGKVRFVGFIGHKDPSIHLKMLATAFLFDSVQMPLNAFDANFHSFEQQVLPELNRRARDEAHLWPRRAGLIKGLDGGWDVSKLPQISSMH